VLCRFPPATMKLNDLWDWEKNKLAANIDLRQTHLEEGALPPGAGHQPLRKTHKGGQSVTESNIHKLHLTPINKVPFQRQLDRKLAMVQEPSRRQAASGMAINLAPQRKPRRHKLTSITAPTAELPVDAGLEDSGPVTLGTAQYAGDLFGSRGDYSNSMLYRSRMDGNKEAAKPPKMQAPLTDAEAEGAEGPDGDRAAEAAAEAVGAADGGRGGAGGGGGDKRGQHEAKQRCAATLRNWSFHEENRKRLMREGAERALMTLATVDDDKTKAYCATAFRNLASEPALRKQLVKCGAVRTIVSLSNSTNAEVNKDCVAALCHLSCLEGSEGRLVDDGSVVTLQYLMQENAELAPLCARALFNLTCVDQIYDRIERVVKVFISMGSSAMATLEIKQICVSALCNLSNLTRVHARMVDEAVVSVLATLARGSDNRTKKLCAVVLQNLASARACRAELVKKGAVQVLISLADTDDEERQHWAAVALCKLIQDRSSRVRIVEEGAISALSAISKAADRRGKVETTRICSAALLTLCSYNESKQLVVDRGAVPVLIQLAKSEDTVTKQNCTLGLCSLLSLQDSAIYIMQQGAVSALVQLSNTDNEGTRASCAAVLYNLSASAETGQLVVKEGFVPAVITLSKAQSLETKSRCAATLCNLTCVEVNRRRMVDERVVPTLVAIMENANENGDEECVRYCTSALCSLSNDPVNTEEIVKDLHVLRAIAQDSWEGEDTKRSMCTVLANLTFLQASRSTLAQLGAVGSLMNYAKLDDNDTRQRCAMAFCNLSCEAAIRGKMVEDGVVAVLGALSNSYSEENQQDCAKALCNLSCHPGAEMRIVEEGAVGALMMIAMVRSVSPLTKDTCAKTLLNLLTPASLELMVDKGLVQALTSLAKLNSECCMSICAHGFCILTANDVGCAAVSSKPATLASLFAIVGRTAEEETRLVAGKAIVNLLQRDDSRELAVSSNVVLYLQELVEPSARRPVGGGARIVPAVSEESKVHCANALFILACHATSRASVLRHKALGFTVKLGDADASEPARLSCARALCQLAWHLETRAALADAGALNALVALSTASGESAAAVRESCTRALCYLALHGADGGSTRRRMLRAGAVGAVVKLCGNTTAEETVARELMGVALRCLACALADGGGGSGEEVEQEEKSDEIELSGIGDDVVEEEKSDDVVEAEAITEEEEVSTTAGAVPLLVQLVRENSASNTAMQADCAVALCDLACCSSLRASMVDEGAHGALMAVAGATTEESTRRRCAAGLRLLATAPANRARMIEAGCVKAVVAMCLAPAVGDAKPKLIAGTPDAVLQDCAAALCALSKSKTGRSTIVAEGAVPLLIELSHSANDAIVQSCSVGLSNLSTASTSVDVRAPLAARAHQQPRPCALLADPAPIIHRRFTDFCRRAP